MANKQTVLSYVEADLRDNERVARACISIVEYLYSESPDNLQHITTGSLQRVVDRSLGPDLLLQAIQYLAGSRAHILETKFEFIDDNDECYPLSNSEVIDARKEGILIHPDSGEVLHDYEDKVFLYFQPSDKLPK